MTKTDCDKRKSKSTVNRAKRNRDKTNLQSKAIWINFTDDLKEKHEYLYKIFGFTNGSELHRYAVTILFNKTKLEQLGINKMKTLMP